MAILSTIFYTLLIQPATNILLFFHYIFNFAHIPYAFGFSIVALTVFTRTLLHPFFHQQMMMTKKMEDMKPQLNELSKMHKDDKKKLQEEQMKLYKENGVNPATGCLFAIVQLPIFIALYQVLTKFVTTGNHPEKVVNEINKMVYSSFLKVHTFDPYFFGMNLWALPSQYQKFGWWYALVPVVTGILQYIQFMCSTPKPASKPKKDLAKGTEKQNENKNSADEMQAMMSAQTKFLFPIMIGFLSFTLPVGLSLYWDIISIFSIVQYVIYRKRAESKK